MCISLRTCFFECLARACNSGVFAEYSAKPPEIITKPPPKDFGMGQRACPVECFQWKAVHTVYKCVQAGKPGYLLEIMPDSQSEAVDDRPFSTELLEFMWEKAEAADEGLKEYFWLPGAPSIVPLLPRHAVADRLQRRTETKSLKELVAKWEELEDQQATEKELVRPCSLLSRVCLVPFYFVCVHAQCSTPFGTAVPCPLCLIVFR